MSFNDLPGMRTLCGAATTATLIAATVLAIIGFSAACESAADRPLPAVSESAVSESDAAGGNAVAGDAMARDDAAVTRDSFADGGGWRPMSVPATTEPDTYPLVIFNPHPVTLIVFADGGAGEVLLDTVDAGDSARVRLLIGADSVTLRAVSPDGGTGAPERIHLTPGFGARWDARY